MAHKKGLGSSKNGRDSNAQRLGVKVFGGERAEAQRLAAKAEEIKRLSLEQSLVGRWFQMLLGLFEAVGPAVVFAIGGALVIQGDNCFSIIDGKRKQWSPWATTITPPVSVHSHHNDGMEQARFLIIQDGGIYYHARAMGFEFAEHPA